MTERSSSVAGSVAGSIAGSVAAPAGLSTAEATARQARWGRNELPQGRRRSALAVIGGVLTEPMVLLLVVATTLYALLGDVAEAIALGLSVGVVVTITVVQQRRTERALDALRDLASPRARVRRDGAWATLDARELVPGDVIGLGEGDRVPADGVLRTGTPLQLDESLLTGESVPVIRHPDLAAAAPGPAGEAGPGVFAGTLVGAGQGTAEVLATGPRSEVGKIGAALGAIDLARAPLEREVTRVVRSIALVALALCALLVVIFVATGRGWIAAALAGITLAMSLLPEELPVVLTVFLALGARRIAKHRVLARRAAAIETLGAVTILCVDKTGTLTLNRMAIAELVSPDSVEVVGDERAALPEPVHALVEYGLLACPQHAIDPMDKAFAALAAGSLAGTEHLHPRWTWLREYPLRPGLLAVTHAWRGDAAHPAGVVVATKGAPEAIIDLCHLPAPEAAAWLERAAAMARRGLRVLGVARAQVSEPLPPDDPHDFPFTLVGLVGLADPLRPDTAATVAACHAAGVRVMMITGDHPDTARAIARAAGLPADAVVTGLELDALPDDALAARLADVHVVARAVPVHKLRIVQALRARGDIVGMTGDGVNDAPALKAADIGIAMGRGTDVAREAAGLVILDDALASIVAAIRTGRAIYDNLGKVAAYLLAVHVPIALLSLLPPVLGWPLLLAPVHIVLLELVIDPTCSIVFELEPPERGIMTRPPRRATARLFHLRRIGFALGAGAAALLGPLAVMGGTHARGLPDEEVRALAFVALIAADLALVTAIRGLGGARNPAAAWLAAGASAIVAVTLAVPLLRHLFGFAVPDPAALGAAIAVGVAPVALYAAVRYLGWQRRPAAR